MVCQKHADIFFFYIFPAKAFLLNLLRHLKNFTLFFKVIGKQKSEEQITIVK